MNEPWGERPHADDEVLCAIAAQLDGAVAEEPNGPLAYALDALAGMILHSPIWNVQQSSVDRLALSVGNAIPLAVSLVPEHEEQVRHAMSCALSLVQTLGKSRAVVEQHIDSGLVADWVDYLAILAHQLDARWRRAMIAAREQGRQRQNAIRSAMACDGHDAVLQ